MSQALAKLNTRDFAALTPHLALEPAADTQGCTQITDALDRLDGSRYLTEATRLIARAMPRREAVWWAWLCAGDTAPADPPAADFVVRAVAEDLVVQQTDHSCRIARDRAQAACRGRPEAWAAIVAFWSGDSMSPEEQPAVPPAAHLAGYCRRGHGGAGLGSRRRYAAARKIAPVPRKWA